MTMIKNLYVLLDTYMKVLPCSVLYPTKICIMHDFVTVLTDIRMNNLDFYTKM